jgi:hypothetical protein
MKTELESIRKMLLPEIVETITQMRGHTMGLMGMTAPEKM